MPAAIIGGAIAGVGSVASAAISSSGASKAANASAAAADRSAAVQQDIYNQNAATLAPYVQAGIPAVGQINALLGLGGDPTAARNAFDQYKNSTGYDFRVDQGMNAVNSGYAGRGAIKSGAAMKAINDYGQGMASQEFGNYLGALGNQQSLGMSAGSALTGVGQNYANSLGNIYQQNGANQANAALARSSAIGSGVNGLANIAGSILGGGSSGGLASPSYTFPTAMNANSLYSGQTGNWQTWG